MTSPKGEPSHEQDVQHLFRAIRKGKGHLTRFMLAASNNTLLNCWDNDGKTPLIECCYIKEEGTRDHMVRILKEAGADVNMKDRNGKTALIHACEQRCNDIVRILIQHCNISPDVEDVDGNTALIHSANIGNDVALELLVRHFRRLGLHVDHYNKAGNTALHVAARNGFIQCAKILALKGKASLTLKDKVHQLTPLEWCLNEGYQKAEVEFLKPSAKFYRVAKLTTTMAKYRKKSTQESASSQMSLRTSPTKVPEKTKSKVKNLLKKSKNQSTEESDLVALGAGCLPSQKAVGGKANDKHSSDKPKAGSPTKSRKLIGKTPRQRSLSQSDKKEDSHTNKKTKSGLSHSHSHPMSTSSESGGNISIEEISKVNRTNGRLVQQQRIVLPDEFGECDTDDFTDTSDSRNLTLSPCSEMTVASTDGMSGYYADGGVYCGEPPKATKEASKVDGQNSYYDEGGVYCGSTPSSSEDLAVFSKRSSGMDTPHTGLLSPTSGDSTPGRFSGSGVEDGSISDNSNDGDSGCSSVEETCETFVDMGLDNKGHQTQKVTTTKANLSTTRGESTKEVDGGQSRDCSSSTPDTDRDTATPKTEAEYIDALHSSRNTTEFVSKDSSKRSSLHKASKNDKSTKATKTSHQPSETVERDFTSPQTEIEYLDFVNCTPYMQLPGGSPQCLPKLKSDVNVDIGQAMGKAGTDSPYCGDIDPVSPETETEYLEFNRYKQPDRDKGCSVGEDKMKRQPVSRSQSESVRGTVGDTETGRDSSSPKTEVEYLDLRQFKAEGHDSKSQTVSKSSRREVSSTICKQKRIEEDDGSYKKSPDQEKLKNSEQTLTENTRKGQQISSPKDNFNSAHTLTGESASDIHPQSSKEEDGRCLAREIEEKLELNHANTLTGNHVKDGLLSCNEDAKTGNIGHFVNSKDFGDKSYRVK